MFRNILVCVDGSPESDQALAEAIDLADCQHSRLTILTAITRPPYWANTPMTAAGIEPMATELEQEAKQALCRAVDRVPDCIPVTKILTESPIRDALACQLKSGNYDLVVLGTHGRGPISASLRKSVSNYAVRHCTVPVLVVRAEEGESREAQPEPRASAQPAITAV